MIPGCPQFIPQVGKTNSVFAGFRFVFDLFSIVVAVVVAVVVVVVLLVLVLVLVLVVLVVLAVVLVLVLVVVLVLALVLLLRWRHMIRNHTIRNRDPQILKFFWFRFSYVLASGRRNCSILTLKSDSSSKTVYIDTSLFFR